MNDFWLNAAILQKGNGFKNKTVRNLSDNDDQILYTNENYAGYSEAVTYFASEKATKQTQTSS